MRYYFAYGSNLCEQQMKKRCRSSRLVGPGVLKEHRLIFSHFATDWGCGAADVIADTNHDVWGLIYQLSSEGFAQLDEYEALGTDYKRKEKLVYTLEGQALHAQVYEVIQKLAQHQKPNATYYNILAEAAEQHHFPDIYRDYLATIECL